METLTLPNSPTLEANTSVARDRNTVFVDGKFLLVNGRRFWVKGVTYGSFQANEEGEPFPPHAQLCDDFAQMRDAGVNTVRIYTPPSDRIADAAADAGLMLVPDIGWGPRCCELDDSERMQFLRGWVRDHARRLANHPAILMFSLGNEVPPLMVRWYSRRRIESFLKSLYEIVKEEAPQSLVTYVNHPPTEHLNLEFLDVISYNVYLEREPEFRRYLARLQMLAGDRPLFLAELGLDGGTHGHEAQAESLDWQLRAVWEKGLCGAAVYSWTDEWSIFDQEIEGWSFGITDIERRPKPALGAVQQIYSAEPSELVDPPRPKVSVVVANYNGAATLDRCLGSLGNLTYPNYEVVVVNDGSTDHSQSIIERHPVRSITVSNGGLSRARNLGVEAATGDIVAFIDSDAWADSDWLHFLVTTLEEHGAAAVGGPNLSPPEDGFVAQCVDWAPGNPTHVLVDDEQAEHVPGCNMAFRKEALLTIKGFEPRHRAAGDDVDVCWKLLARGEQIVFSPGAFVWHHRRGSVRAFWRQQVGYGVAEGHLARYYPGRFNVFGDLVWAGSVYDGLHLGLRGQGLPRLFPPRVYQGRFGSAPFQSIYQPFRAWWFQIFTTAEWQLVTVLLALSSGLAFWSQSAAAIYLLIVTAAMMFATLSVASVPAQHAVHRLRWKGRRGAAAKLMITFLHIMQPLARGWGRLRGSWDDGREPYPEFPAEQRLYGNLRQREEWLNRLQEHLRACGWSCRPTCNWGEADLDILGPGPYTLKLCSTYEEDLERGQHYVRYRIRPRAKLMLPFLYFAVFAPLGALYFAPYLAPLAVPAVIALKLLLQTRCFMVRAVSQLAVESAEPIGMSCVGDQPNG
jgi:GT2 family glycosyltransferase